MFQRDQTSRSATLSPPRHAGLPPGIRQSDCDGPFDPQADFSPEQLWQACDERLQHQIAERFAAARADEVRDLLLEAEFGGFPGKKLETKITTLGVLLWRSWIAFRNSAVEDVYRRGHLPR